MQISGTGHWFLEGWIDDHSVEFLVDSGSSVTAMSDTFYQTLVHAGAPLGTYGLADGVSATLRRELTQLLELMYWDRYCHTPWT